MFEPDLFFCNDGVLRVKMGNKPMLPLQFIYSIHKKTKGDTFSFMTYWMKRTTHFEENLTVGKFLSCLEPWGDFFKLITDTNVPAYIEEVKKPFSVKRDDNTEDVDYLMIYYSTVIRDDVDYKREKEEIFDIEKHLNSRKEARLSGYFLIDGHFTCSGYRRGIVEEYSVSHTPLKEIVNTPIFLSDKQFVFFENYHRHKILEENKSLLNTSGYGVVDSQFNKQALIGNINYKLEDVVTAFFDWMAYEPSSRDAFNEELKALVLSAQEQYDNETNSKNSTPTGSPNQVIDFDQATDSDQDTDSDQTTEEPLGSESGKTQEEVKVSIMPGAFQSITEHAQEEMNIYNTYLEIAKKDNSAIIRIGGLKKAACEETRMKKQIISKQVPTKYKKI